MLMRTHKTHKLSKLAHKQHKLKSLLIYVATYKLIKLSALLTAYRAL